MLDSSKAPYTFHHSTIYVAWQTDEIIGFELWRNILLAITAIFLVTLLLLANFQICFYILLTVIMNLTDIIGLLHFWGITIDIISSINIILSIGLCVDYSVHIALAYMVASGSRRDRAVTAVTTIGPAVVNGGITTFLSLLLCSLTHSQVLRTFFKVFLLTVTFGLLHGVLLLPIILALAGPQNNMKKQEQTNMKKEPSKGTVNTAYIGDGTAK